MYVYLIVNCLIFLSSSLCENLFCRFKGTSKYATLLYKFWCVILLFLSASRYGIGTDYWVYYDEYLNAAWRHADLNLISYTIHFLKICNLPFQIIIIICTCMFLLPVMYLIRQLCNNYKLFSLGVLMGLSYYVYSYNIFRQYAAIGLMLLFLYKWVFTLEKRYLFALIIPALIHPSSLVAILVYCIIDKVKVKYKILQILAILGIAVFLFVPVSVGSWIIREGFQLFSNTIYGGYATSQDTAFLMRIYNQNMEFVPKMLIIPFLIALPIMLNRVNESRNDLKRSSEMDKKQIKLLYVQEFFLKIYFCYFLLMSLKIGSEIVTRFLMYFSIVSVWAIPMLLNSTDINKWIKRILILFIIAVSVRYHILWLNGNGCEAYPYQSIFSIILR